ncbi:MAG TPA: hypothetical protein PK435_14425 [Thermoanaerobaculaceae bacterium]|nr:hypothetical protein [Thermoanaerobaculaceae bacterium]
MRGRVLTVVVAALVAAVASAYQNEEPGFRGHDWGMTLPRAWGLPVQTDPSFGGIRLYEDPGEARTMGCAKLESVEYGFWQGRLSDVRVEVRGYDNYKCVLDNLKEQFDDGVRPNPTVERYVWAGGVTTIVLAYDPQAKKGYLTLVSKGMLSEQREWERAQAKKPAGAP